VHLIIDVNGYFIEEAGSTVAYHVYYPFGEEATAFDQDTIREKFTGHERDLGNLSGAGDDLDYMHARFCSPVTGRFLSADPLDGNPRFPQSWNRYAYVKGGPLRYSDPDGLAELGRVPPPVGMTFSDSITVLAPPWLLESQTIQITNPGLLSFLYFRNWLDSINADDLDRGIARLRSYYENRFDQMAVEGNNLSALIDYIGLDMVIPKDKGDLVIQLGIAIIPELKASGEITGLTKHAVNQMISREGVGVSSRAALDAVKNPLKVVVNEGRGSIKYVGKNATVVLSKAGVIITTWARNAAGFRIIP
jgi:RHS repeat-associated protein